MSSLIPKEIQAIWKKPIEYGKEFLDPPLPPGFEEQERLRVEEQKRLMKEQRLKDVEVGKETERIKKEKAEADKKAKEKGILLRKRRIGKPPYRTPGGAAGLLGQAPVRLKTLLGQ